MTHPTSKALLIIAQQMNEQGVDFRTDVHGIEALCLQEAAYEIERLRAELAAQNWQPIETAPKDASLILMKFEKKDLYKDQVFEMFLTCIQIGHVDIVYWLEDFESLPFFVKEYDLKNDRWFSIVVGQYVNTKKRNPTHWMPLPTPPQPEK